MHNGSLPPLLLTCAANDLRDFDDFIIEVPSMLDQEDGNEDEEEGVEETYSTYSASQDPTSPAFISPSTSKSSNTSNPNGTINASNNSIVISSTNHKMKKNQLKLKTFFHTLKRTWISGLSS
ncbi:hypothetical protein BT96DRAFT_531414 [Gymnopus androsaceus JB14]|uniref:Uncharacterized protein n=1 Tax=Gymnopus androsaceus JB14 TaxID=1447944 RepID=A0A6A4IG56_9AGAR|nr:hypothetical protein BT96DRAFT_531414 [Gymnopus androsaceus JB14]